MHTVQHILDRKPGPVTCIDRESTVLDAAKLMNEKRIGALVVNRGETVIGIFTERDILNRVVAAQKVPAKTLVKDVMTTPVACCKPETTEAECRHVMREKRIRHLPVVANERLVGMISIGDITEDENAEQQETIEYLHEYLYGGYR
ncbi:MAG: CBS domain-containing protein [Planctomycetes bacterium]|nr:CBS domain-containing protein [Planctomycetota bacterium]